MRKCLLLFVFACLASAGFSQERLQKFPRYDRYLQLRSAYGSLITRGDLALGTWSEDSKAFYYNWNGKNWGFNVADRSSKEAEPPKPTTPPTTRPRRPGGSGPNPGRGRQYATAESNDKTWKAQYKEGNVYVTGPDGVAKAITTDGDLAARQKNGTASWVYGEELGVREAMWWSPDNKYLGYYHFDERQVPDFYMSTSNLQFLNKLYVEPFPKPGTENPIVELRIYHRETGKTVTLETMAEPGDRNGVGHYLYQVNWSPDGKELLFLRANRRQNTVEWCAGDPVTGEVRSIVKEAHETGWAVTNPTPTWLKEQAGKPRRFLWISERTGYRNLYLCDLGGSIKPLTKFDFDLDRMVRVDEDTNTIWVSARGGDTPYLAQLYRVNMASGESVRITDPKFHHGWNISPDGKHIIDVAEKLDVPPTTRMLNANGDILATLAESNLDKYNEMKLKRVEKFTYHGGDGKTTLFGELHFPADFDPNKKYPLVMDVYGGPDTAGGFDRFALPQAITEFGILTVSFDVRGSNGRGWAFRTSVYRALGVAEIDDCAAGVKFLGQRPYVDAKRVGIFGGSYGGYFALMSILRHPNVFQVAVASSSVTDWRNYDSIYAERYMDLLDNNKEGYDAGSAMKHASQLSGKLMLFYGTSDDNVHPMNTFQIAAALNRAGKNYDVAIGPDQGHVYWSQDRIWEYLFDFLKPGS